MTTNIGHQKTIKSSEIVFRPSSVLKPFISVDVEHMISNRYCYFILQIDPVQCKKQKKKNQKNNHIMLFQQQQSVYEVICKDRDTVLFFCLLSFLL